MRIDMDTYLLAYSLTLWNPLGIAQRRQVIRTLGIAQADRLPSAALLLANTLEPVFADSLHQACEGRRN